MDVVHVDFETRSAAELRGSKSVGLYNYATDKSTQPVMLGWAINDEQPSLWEIAKGDSMPQALAQSLKNPLVKFAAWNSQFERYMFKYKLGVDIPYSRWVDPQASARYLSLPDDLETAGHALGLPKDFLKDEDGERLINIFSKLSKPRKKKAKKGEIVVEPVPYFRDWNTDPEDWQKFGEYCIQDVVTEREIMRRLGVFGVFPLPEREYRLWMLDQKINDRGVPTSRVFVQNSSAIGVRAKQDAWDKQKAATGLENPNSGSQMLAWVRERGYEANTLRKEYVTQAIEDVGSPLTEEARVVLKARKTSSSTSYKKLGTILRQLCPDDRLRNQFIYMGSSRAARWSSGAVQLHNMARPEPQFEDEEVLIDVREKIYNQDYDGLVKYYGEPLLAVKSSIRSAFEAPEGKRLNAADLNAIETRVAAWIAGCQPLLAVFARPNGDPYLEFASKMTGIPYDELYRDYHGKDKAKKAIAKRYRQMAKPGVLGCVYRLGAGTWGHNKYGDPIKTGLWGYAENMGVKMTEEETATVVSVFRESYPEIVQVWYALENAVHEVLKGAKKATASLGPDGCIKIDKLNRKDQNPILRIQLPSGRFLHYVDARIEDTLMPWKKKIALDDGTVGEQDVYKPTLVYAGVNQDTKQWESFVTSHGGKLLENITQSIARDVLAEGMLRADEADMDIVLHVHDEIGTESYDDAFDPDYKDLEKLMSIPMAWAPTLPLGADGYSGRFYHK